jgi:Tol biopolymer transport system component/DNA-binding winged helix-turn-helix (wHTH) protein
VNGAFFVAGIRVEARLNRIHTSDGVIQVEPKIMQVLECLVRSPGEVISKDALINEVWPDTSATDDVLARAISELRKAFDDDPKSPRVIETIRKGGYRLLAPVSKEEPGKPRITPARTGIVLLLAVAAVLAWMGFNRSPPAPATSKILPLTSYKGIEQDPAISPNGTLVAFAWNGPDQDNWDIYVKLRGEETPQRLTQSPAVDGSPAWSPDGDRIAFRRRSEEACELMVVPAIGGHERPLADCRDNQFADLVWSPDGRWLAHNDALGAGLHGIVLVDANSGESRVLTSPPAGIWGDFDPAFSPDGSSLAFARAWSEGIQDILIMHLDRPGEKQVTFDQRNIYGLTWTPDGQSIIYGSNRHGDYDLWRVPTEGGEPEAFLSGIGNLVNPVIDRIGTNLVYEHRQYDTDIWRYQLAPGPGSENPDVIASSTRWELYPALSATGQRLAYASDRSGSYEIWVSDVDGASPTRLTEFGGPLTSAPSWAPDDSLLAFDGRPDGHADIFLIDPVGGKPQRLTNDPGDDLAPSWSLDGQWVLFASNRTGSWQVWRSNRDASRIEQLTREGGFRALDTPHGVYYTRFGEAGLWSMDAEGENRRFEFPDPVDWGNWYAGNAGIYQIERSTGRSIIILHPWDDEPRKLFETSGMVPPSDAALGVSRDGQTLVYGQIQQRWVDLVLVTAPQL